jgi:hypothetical protein
MRQKKGAWMRHPVLGKCTNPHLDLWFPIHAPEKRRKDGTPGFEFCGFPPMRQKKGA